MVAAFCLVFSCLRVGLCGTLLFVTSWRLATGPSGKLPLKGLPVAQSMFTLFSVKGSNTCFDPSLFGLLCLSLDFAGTARHSICEGCQLSLSEAGREASGKGWAESSLQVAPLVSLFVS